jgi:hypothetical protein
MAPKIIEAPDGKMIEFPEDMADSMINLVMAKQYPIPAIAAQPSFMERMTPSPQTISNFVRPGLEYGGMLAGGVMAAPAGPAGVIAGAGLGYAGGRQAANLADQFLLDKKTPDALTQISNAGKDFVSGTTMEMGGGILANLLNRGGSAIANSGLPEWLYSKAMKTPMSEAWKRTIPTKEWTKREKVLETGMAEEITPTSLGKEQVVSRIREIDGQVRTIVSDLTKQSEAIQQAAKIPPSTTVNPIQKGWENFNGVPPTNIGYDTKVADLIKALDPLKARAKMARDSAMSGNAVGAIESEIIKKGGAGSRLSPDQLQILKQEFYKDIDFDLTKKIVNENGRFTTDATKAIAQKAMERLEELAPELAYLNKQQGYYIDLQKAIEHTLARYENTNAVGLGAKMMSIRNVGMAALEVVSGTPSFKASLALSLKKAGNIQAKNIGKAAMIYGTENPQF